MANKIISEHSQYKHGMAKSREHYSWRGMRGRCQNPNNRKYPDYGGRGIIVCDRWNNSFENFYADMGKKPAGVSLGRIDNDGPYSPENCRWENGFQQSNNKRNNRLITINSRTKTVPQWARFYHINPKTVHTRLGRGWSEIDALTKPLMQEPNHK